MRALAPLWPANWYLCARGLARFPPETTCLRRAILTSLSWRPSIRASGYPARKLPIRLRHPGMLAAVRGSNSIRAVETPARSASRIPQKFGLLQLAWQRTLHVPGAEIRQRPNDLGECGVGHV